MYPIKTKLLPDYKIDWNFDNTIVPIRELEFTEIDCKTDTTYIEMLSGKGFRGMPVLQVGDEYFDFIKANKWIGEQ